MSRAFRCDALDTPQAYISKKMSHTKLDRGNLGLTDISGQMGRPAGAYKLIYPIESGNMGELQINNQQQQQRTWSGSGPIFGRKLFLSPPLKLIYSIQTEMFLVTLNIIWLNSGSEWLETQLQTFQPANENCETVSNIQTIFSSNIFTLNIFHPAHLTNILPDFSSGWVESNFWSELQCKLKWGRVRIVGAERYHWNRVEVPVEALVEQYHWNIVVVDNFE